MGYESNNSIHSHEEIKKEIVIEEINAIRKEISTYKKQILLNDAKFKKVYADETLSDLDKIKEIRELNKLNRRLRESIRKCERRGDMLTIDSTVIYEQEKLGYDKIAIGFIVLLLGSQVILQFITARKE